MKKFLSLALVLIIGITLAACGDDKPTPVPATPTTAPQSVTARTLPPVPTNTPGIQIIPPTDTILPTIPADFYTRWLRGEPCSPPCWEGITPGKTTVSEAAAILSRNPYFRSTNRQAKGPDLDAPALGYVLMNGVKGGDIYFQANGERVFMIQPYVSPGLAEITRAYGEPSHVIASANKQDKVLTYNLWLIYLSKGFAIQSGLQTTNFSFKYAISNEILTSKPTFFVADKDGFKSVFKLNLDDKKVVAWQGFKDFAFYCREGTDVGPEICSVSKT